ncbi:MAG: hypothetical protein ABFS56_23320 [Pseudomonadota bacterium]
MQALTSTFKRRLAVRATVWASLITKVMHKGQNVCEDAIKALLPELKTPAGKQTVVVLLEIEQFEMIYKWFDEVLNIILPTSKPVNIAIQSHTDFKMFFSHILKSFDLGIKQIYFEAKRLILKTRRKYQRQLRKKSGKIFLTGKIRLMLYPRRNFLFIIESLDFIP